MNLAPQNSQWAWSSGWGGSICSQSSTEPGVEKTPPDGGDALWP